MNQAFVKQPSKGEKPYSWQCHKKVEKEIYILQNKKQSHTDQQKIADRYRQTYRGRHTSKARSLVRTKKKKKTEDGCFCNGGRSGEGLNNKNANKSKSTLNWLTITKPQPHFLQQTLVDTRTSRVLPFTEACTARPTTNTQRRNSLQYICQETRKS